MATPNYAYEKRQRELAKKRKKEEKLKRKSAEGKSPDDDAKAHRPGRQRPAAERDRQRLRETCLQLYRRPDC